MTPEQTKLVGQFLKKAHRFLMKANAFLDFPFFHEAARAVYLAAFHAAQAYIFALTGKVAKTHSGVRAEFSRLAKDDPHIRRQLLAFLAQAYEQKSVADYGLEEIADLSDSEARATLKTADDFVKCIEKAVTDV